MKPIETVHRLRASFMGCPDFFVSSSNYEPRVQSRRVARAGSKSFPPPYAAAFLIGRPIAFVVSTA